MLIEQVGPKSSNNVVVTDRRQRHHVEGHETGGARTGSQRSCEVGSLTPVLEGNPTIPLFSRSFMEGHL